MMQPDLSIIRDDVRVSTAYPVPPSTGFIKLDAMESPFGLPATLARELGAKLALVELNRYPPSDPAPFKVKLAHAAALPAGMQLMLGNGSDELIHLVIQACAKPGTCVLSPWPSFVMYEMSARFDQCRFVGVPLRGDFSLDADAILAAIARERPAVVFIAWPNNPTGNLFDAAAVTAILDAAPGLVVMDEAYLPFALDTWMPKLLSRPNLLVLRTLSKLGLAGIRLGYLAGHPTWIGEFEKVRPPYNVNVLTLAVADFMLDHLPLLDEQAAIIRSERSRVLAGLRAITGVEAFDSAANFILFHVADADRAFARLKERGILIKNVSRMNPLLAGCLRTTIGTPAENDAFIEALTTSLS